MNALKFYNFEDESQMDHLRSNPDEHQMIESFKYS